MFRRDASMMRSSSFVSYRIESLLRREGRRGLLQACRPRTRLPTRFAQQSISTSHDHVNLFALPRSRGRGGDIRKLSSHGIEEASERRISPQAAQLFRLQSLINAVGETNRKSDKEEILRQYGDLESLLRFLFHPNVRTFVRPLNLIKYFSRLESEEDDPEATFDYASEETDISLLQLFEKLDQRERTGNEALHLLASYLYTHQILAIADKQRKEDSTSLTLLDVFLRCLDRNFKVGVNEKIISSAFSKADDQQSMNELARSPLLFGAALGKTVEGDELEKLFQLKAGEAMTKEKTWFVSRKLDGVRCIIQVDLQRPKLTSDVRSEGEAWQISNIQTFSRNGRCFTSLGILTEYLSLLLENSEVIKALLRRAKEAGQELSEDDALDDEQETASIFLDGEVCMLVPAPVKVGKEDAKVDGALPIVEDFQAIVGPIKRKDYTVDNPAYFPFDLLTFSEFYHWRTESNKHDPFHVRVSRVQRLVEECRGRDANNIDLTVVRHLEQKPVCSVDEVKAWMLLAAKNGWEGLILRRGGHYEGKRSSSIRKLKQFHEEEYEVVDVDIAEMRLPIGQQYAQRMALSSAVVLHKGTRVHIGSGFTAEQRIRFAEHPESLIGKQITVAYFGESRSATRTGQDELSLRFPTVKAIWEDGARDV